MSYRQWMGALAAVGRVRGFRDIFVAGHAKTRGALRSGSGPQVRFALGITYEVAHWQGREVASMMVNEL